MDQPDLFPPMPSATPVAGDNVLYSTRFFVDHTSGRPKFQGGISAAERQMNQITGSFQADQDATVKLQFWDQVSGTWVTQNNNGNGDAAPAAGGPANFTFDILHGGDWQVAVNFATPPTSWKVPTALRLTRKAASS